jgi:hypothetical protein
MYKLIYSFFSLIVKTDTNPAKVYSLNISE